MLYLLLERWYEMAFWDDNPGLGEGWRKAVAKLAKQKEANRLAMGKGSKKKEVMKIAAELGMMTGNGEVVGEGQDGGEVADTAIDRPVPNSPKGPVLEKKVEQGNSQVVEEGYKKRPGDISRRVIELRGPMTQIDLANVSGINQGTISRIENGADPRLSVVMRLASTFGVSVADLLEG